MSDIKSDINLGNEENSFQKVTYLSNAIRNDNFQGNSKPKNIVSKKVKIILPNLSKSSILLMNNKISEKEKFMNKNIKNENKDATNSIILNNSINNKIEKKKKLNLNKSVSLPSLKENNIILNGTQIKECSSIKNYNFSNKILNKSYNQNLLNFNKSRQKIKNNLLSNNDNRFENSSLNREKLFDLKSNKNINISKSCINYKNTKNITNSTFKISKIKLNETIIDKKLFKKLNSSLSCKNSEIKSFYRPDSTIIRIPKHSKFFKISQKDSISARRIYKHYLRKSQGEFAEPIRNYKKFFDDRSKTILEKLSRIYGENENFLSIIKELKDNKKLAYKEDFNVEEYQSTIVELLDQRVSPKYLLELQNIYRDLNKKLYGVVEPKGRFTLLAEKLKYNLPLYLLEKLKQLDKDSVINRMKYYNKFKRFKDKKLITLFNNKSMSENKNYNLKIKKIIKIDGKRE